MLKVDIKDITRWGNTKSKVYRNLKAKRICVLQEEKKGGERNWAKKDIKFGKNQFSTAITLELFPCLLALFWGLGYELRGICEEGDEQLELHVQSIFHWLFSR
jgi:hypothetical protein